MSIGEAAVSSVTELVPITWESAKGVAKVLNPVNIVSHLTGDNEEIESRPTTVVGITQASGTIGENEGLVGVIYLLAALNVFVGVFNMLPVAAARRRARRHRHVRTGPRARATRCALLRRRLQADAVRPRGDHAAPLPVHVRAVPRRDETLGVTA